MDKRELRKYPLPVVTKKIEKLGTILRKNKVNEYIAEASIKDGMLIVDIFDIGPKGEKVLPYARSFFTDDDYITLNLQSKKTAWKTGALKNILGYQWAFPVKSELHMASAKDAKTADGWLRQYIKSHKVKNYVKPDYTCDLIDAYQEDILHRRLVKKWLDQRRWIDERMKAFGNLPEDFMEWTDKTAMYEHNFIFYNKPKKYAYCSRCGNEFKISDDEIILKKAEWVKWQSSIKHNKYVVCPYCISKDIGIKTMAKSMGYSRKNLVEAQWVVIITPVEIDGKSAVTIRYLCCTKDYSFDFYQPKINMVELLRTIHFEDHQECYELVYDYRFDKLNWLPEKRETWYWNPSKFQAPLDGEILYNPSFDSLKGSWLQYACIEEYRDIYLKYTKHEHTTSYFYDGYINFYRKNMYIEKFIKIGWTKLTIEIIQKENDISDKLNKAGSTVTEVLGITREQFLILKQVTGNPRWHDIEIFRFCYQEGITITADEYSKLKYTDNDIYKQYLRFKNCSTIHKLVNYCNKLPRELRPIDYFDYLAWTRDLGYDMRNSFNLFPKDFRQAHDQRNREYMKHKNKIHKKAAAEFNKFLKKHKQNTDDSGIFNIENKGGLFIRLPEQISELKKEGEALHHCVGTYAEKVMKGETWIFFIRRISEPDKSYYTLEWKDGMVIQCRGMKNCDMTPEVKKFVNLFKDKMAEYEKKFMKVRKAV